MAMGCMEEQASTVYIDPETRHAKTDLPCFVVARRLASRGHLRSQLVTGSRMEGRVNFGLEGRLRTTHDAECSEPR